MGEIFAAIPKSSDPRLLVGFENSDDGAVFRLDDRTALVQSIDFFTPIVDGPEDFGAIAAANALSDIYAMGGRPLTALSLVCFPYKTLPAELLTRIVRGGAAKIAESGAMVVGGHSVGDEEIKFGYAVTGEVAPDRYWSNNTPRIGDALVLTKPLGTGLITTAVKQDKLANALLVEPIAEMSRLNRVAAELAQGYEIHAATDITGFGLIGHLFEMLRGLQLGATLKVADLALFEGVWQAIEQKAFTLAHRTNREYTEAFVEATGAAHDHHEKILYDPQTSGGLLLALPAEQTQSLLKALTDTGHRPSLVGRVEARPGIRCA